MSTNTYPTAGCGRKLVPVALLALLSACSNGSSGGGVPKMAFEDETTPNNTPATANLVRVGAPIHGDLATAGDVDTFAMSLTGGRVLKIELFATRHDQAGWGAGDNIPRLTLLDTDAHEHAKLLEQDYSGNFSDGWSWGFHDLDIPMYLVPASGTYFVQVTQDDQVRPGSSYILRASYVNIPGLQQEIEPAATSGANETFDTAEVIRLGTLHGFHVEGEKDFYKFTITAPSIVRFQMTAYRNGVWGGTSAYYDTEIYLLDTDGTTILTGDDDTYFYDSAIDYRIDTPGTYYLDVDEYDAATGEYFISYESTPVGGALESEPNDDFAHANPVSYGDRRNGQVAPDEEDWFAFSGKAGDTVYLQVFDQYNSLASGGWVDAYLYDTDGLTRLNTGGGSSLRTETTILQFSGTFYVLIRGGEGVSNYTFELTRPHTAILESEPNGELADANALATRIAGVIDVEGNADMFRIDLRKDQLVRFVCYASASMMDSNGDWEHSGFGSELVPSLELLNAEGLEVAQATSAPEYGVYAESVTQPLPSCGLIYTADAAGTYYLRLSTAQAGYGASHYYVIEYERR